MTRRTGSEPFQTGRIVTISAGHAVHDTYTAFLPPLLPTFIAQLSISKTEAGLLAAFLQGPSLLQPFIGHLADRVGLRYAVTLAPAIAGSMMSLLGVTGSYGFVAVLLVVAGLGSAALHAVGPVMAGHFSGRSLGRGMGFWMVGGELGRTLGPIVVVTAVRLLTLERIPWLMIGGIAASIALSFLLRHVPALPPNAGSARPWRQALRGMRPVLFPLAGLITVRAFILASLTLYLPTLLHEEGASLWAAGAALSVLEAAGMVGALTGGAISDRLGRRTVLIVSMAATSLMMFLFLAAAGWIRFALLLLMGFTALSVAPVVMALVQESCHENRALANGIYMSLAFGIRSVVAVVMGAVGDLLGLRLAFTASAALALLGLPFSLWLPKGRSAADA